MTLQEIIMNATTTNLLISLISAIATVSAAIIYYYTLKELKRQRENTYKPNLFIDKTYFFVQGVKKNEFIMPIKWTNTHFNRMEILEHDEKKHTFLNFSLKCFNIGFGTATNVNVCFSYDIKKLVKNIKSLEEEVPNEQRIGIEIKGNFLSFDYKSKKLPYTSKIISINGNLNQYTSFILPVNINNNFSNIKLPIHFLELLNIYVLYFSYNMKKEIEVSIPPMKTKIKYHDISGKEILKEFTIITELNTMGIAGYSGEFKV